MRPRPVSQQCLGEDTTGHAPLGSTRISAPHGSQEEPPLSQRRDQQTPQAEARMTRSTGRGHHTCGMAKTSTVQPLDSLWHWAGQCTRPRPRHHQCLREHAVSRRRRSERSLRDPSFIHLRIHFTSVLGDGVLRAVWSCESDEDTTPAVQGGDRDWAGPPMLTGLCSVTALAKAQQDQVASEEASNTQGQAVHS